MSDDSAVGNPTGSTMDTFIAPESPTSMNPYDAGSLLRSSSRINMTPKPRLPNMGINITRGSEV